MKNTVAKILVLVMILSVVLAFTTSCGEAQMDVEMQITSAAGAGTISYNLYALTGKVADGAAPADKNAKDITGGTAALEKYARDLATNAGVEVTVSTVADAGTRDLYTGLNNMAEIIEPCYVTCITMSYEFTSIADFNEKQAKLAGTDVPAASVSTSGKNVTLSIDCMTLSRVMDLMCTQVYATILSSGLTGHVDAYTMGRLDNFKMVIGSTEKVVNLKGIRNQSSSMQTATGSPEGMPEPTIASIEPVAVNTPVNTAPVLPDKVTVKYSDDTTAQLAVVWDAVDASAYTRPEPTEPTDDFTFEVNGAVEGTDIKAVATVTVQYPVIPPQPKLELKDGLAYGVKAGMTPADLDDISIYDSNGNMIGNDKPIATGYIYKFNGTDYPVVVMGDLDRDGAIKGNDYIVAMKIFLGDPAVSTLSSAVLAAADVDRNGSVTGNDYIIIMKHFLGMIDLNDITAA